MFGKYNNRKEDLKKICDGFLDNEMFDDFDKSSLSLGLLMGMMIGVYHCNGVFDESRKDGE